MAMQLVTDLYYFAFVVVTVIVFTEQAYPFVVYLCIRDLQRGEGKLWFCTGQKLFTSLEFEPC